MSVGRYFVRFLLTTNLLQLSINFNVDGRFLRTRFPFFRLLTFTHVRQNVAIKRRFLMEELVRRVNYTFRNAYRDVRSNGVYSGSVFQIDEIPTDFNVRIYATIAWSIIASGLRRNLYRFRIIGQGLVHVPSILVVTTIYISEPRRSIICDRHRFVFRHVSYGNNVVRFSVRFRILVRSIDLRRTSGYLYVSVVLVLYQFRKFQFGRRDTLRAAYASVVANGNRRLYRVFFFTFLVDVRRQRVTFTSAPGSVIHASRFGNNVGHVLCLSDNANRGVGVKVNNYAIRMAHITRCVNHSPRRFSTYFNLFLLNVDGRLFRINLVNFSTINFHGRVSVVRTVVPSTRFLRGLRANVRFVLNYLRKVEIAIP